jgi:hypothetical protein
MQSNKFDSPGCHEKVPASCMNEWFKKGAGGLAHGGYPGPSGTRGPPIYRVVHASPPIFFIEFIIRILPEQARHGPDRSWLMAYAWALRPRVPLFLHTAGQRRAAPGSCDAYSMGISDAPENLWVQIQWVTLAPPHTGNNSYAKYH